MPVVVSPVPDRTYSALSEILNRIQNFGGTLGGLDIPEESLRIVTRSVSFLSEALSLSRLSSTNDAELSADILKDFEVAGLWGILTGAEGRLKRTPSVEQLEEIASDLTSWADTIVRRLPQYVTAISTPFADMVRGDAEWRVAQLLQRMRDASAERQLTEISHTADRVKGLELQTLAARDSAREASGATADQSLAKFWGDFADRQNTTANIWRTAAILIVVATVILGLIVGAPDSTAAAIQHAASSVVLLGLAGYLAAEAGRHRRAAQWAEAMEVQLKSLDAFCQTVGEGASAIRQNFAARVFGEAPVGQHSTEITPLAQLGETAASVLKR